METQHYKKLYDFIIASQKLELEGLEDSIPQIVVIGCQNAGKSTLLNRIIGYPMLPTKERLCSKFPVKIYLKKESNRKIEGRIGDNSKRKTIEELTDHLKKINDKTTDICNKPIHITLYGDYPNLIIVDLPGLAINSDKDDVIQNIASEYAKMEQSIILTVQTITEDLDTSFAIKKSTEYDPEGKRTYHVLTKCDISLNKEKAQNVLNNQLLEKSCGVVLTINSFDGQRLEDFTKLEKEKLQNYFDKNDAENHGLPNLQNILGKNLEERIRCQSDIIKQKIKRTKNNYMDLGNCKSSSSIVNDSVHRFNQKFKNILEGRMKYSSDRIKGGAHIQMTLDVDYTSAIKDLKLSERKEIEIYFDIINVRGSRRMNNSIEKGCKNILEEEIDQLHQPCSQAIENIKEHLLEIVKEALEQEKLDTVKAAIQTEIHGYIDEQENCIKRVLEDMIASEKICVTIDETLVIKNYNESDVSRLWKVIKESATNGSNDILFSLVMKVLPSEFAAPIKRLLTLCDIQDIQEVVKYIYTSETENVDLPEDVRAIKNNHSKEDMLKYVELVVDQVKSLCFQIRKTSYAVRIYFEDVKMNFLRNFPMRVRYTFVEKVIESTKELGKMVSRADEILGDEYQKKQNEIKSKIEEIDKTLAILESD